MLLVVVLLELLEVVVLVAGVLMLGLVAGLCAYIPDAVLSLIMDDSRAILHLEAWQEVCAGRVQHHIWL